MLVIVIHGLGAWAITGTVRSLQYMVRSPEVLLKRSTHNIARHRADVRLGRKVAIRIFLSATKTRFGFGRILCYFVLSRTRRKRQIMTDNSAPLYIPGALCMHLVSNRAIAVAPTIPTNEILSIVPLTAWTGCGKITAPQILGAIPVLSLYLPTLYRLAGLVALAHRLNLSS